MFMATSKPKTLVASTSSHDFEPYCEWKREETCDKLIVHVPDFKKEHLRVQVNYMGGLKITGDRPADSKGTKRSQFYKESKLPENCEVNDVQAKLSHGKLTISMPKKPKSSLTELLPASTAGHDDDLIPSLQVVQRRLGNVAKGFSLPEKMGIGGGGVGHHDHDDETVVGFGRFRVGKKTAVGIGIAVLGVAVVTALVVYKNKSSGGDDSLYSSSATKATSCGSTTSKFAE